MGWKAFNIFASVPDGGALTSFPRHDPDKARELLALLPDLYECRGGATFERALYPQDDDELYVGAYEHVMVLGSTPFAASAFADGVPPIIEYLSVIVPGCRALAVVLHSVVDMYGYACFENGQLVRGRAASAADGVFFETGEPLPIERELLEHNDTAGGEEIVMELCRPFLGCRIDEFSAWDLQMEMFVRKR